MGKIYQIIKKNLRILTKSKSSVLFLILSPLIVIGLFLFFYTYSSSYNVSIGYVSSTINSDPFVKKLEENNLILNKYDSENECLSNIKIGRIDGCIIFPVDFEIMDGKENNLVIYVDNSKSNINFITKKLLLDLINSKVKEIQTQNTENLLNVLGSNENYLFNQKKYLDNVSDLRERLIEENSKLEKSIDSLEKSLKGGIFEEEDLDEVVDDFKQTMDDYVIDVAYILNDSRNAVEELGDLIQDSNATNKNSLRNTLEDIEDELYLFELKLNGISNLSSVNSLDSNLNSFSDNKDDFEEFISEVKHVISSNSEALDLLGKVIINVENNNGT